MRNCLLLWAHFNLYSIKDRENINCQKAKSRGHHLRYMLIKHCTSDMQKFSLQWGVALLEASCSRVWHPKLLDVCEASGTRLRALMHACWWTRHSIRPAADPKADPAQGKKKKKKVPVDSRQMHNRRYSESLLMPLFPNPRIRWTDFFNVRSGPSRHCWWSHPHACPDWHWVAFCLLQKWAKSRCTFPYVVLLQSSLHRCKMRVDLLMMPISYKLQHARKKIIFTAT